MEQFREFLYRDSLIAKIRGFFILPIAGDRALLLFLDSFEIGITPS